MRELIANIAFFVTVACVIVIFFIQWRINFLNIKVMKIQDHINYLVAKEIDHINDVLKELENK